MTYQPPANITPALRRLINATNSTESRNIRMPETPQYKPITKTFYQAKTFTNPITRKELKNSYANRARVNKRIEEENIKLRERSKVLEQQFNARFGQVINTREFSFASKIRYENPKITDKEGFYNWVNYIRNQRKELGSNFPIKFSSVTLYFQEPSGRIVNRTLTISDFNDKSKFDTAFAELQDNGTNTGSDVVSGLGSDGTEFIPSKVEFWGLRASGANGNSTKCLFDIEKVNGDKKRAKGCINKSLKLIGYQTKDKMDTLEQLTNYIKKHRLPIRIISNMLQYIEIPDNAKYSDYKDNNTNKRISVTPLNKCAIKLNTIYEPTTTDYEHTLIYIEEDKHIDVIPDNMPIISDNVYVTEFLSIYKSIDSKFKRIYTIKDIYKANPVEKQQMNVKYVFFDYETIINWSRNNVMHPYSASWFWYTHDELESMIEDEKKIAEVFGNPENRKNVINFDCSYQFIKWILDNEHNTIFKFVGFNSANFDNFLLLNDMMEYKQTICKDDLSVTDILYNGNQLLNYKINGRHTMYDIRKHLVGSLAANCKAFKVPKKYCKVSGFSHDDMQMLYDKDNEGFINTIKENKELVEYNDCDVLATGYLFMKYYQSTTNIDKLGYDFLEGEQFTNTNTIGSIIWKRAQNHWKNKGVILPKLSVKQYNDILASKAAGRVDLFKAAMNHIVDEIVSLDVCSLYPYIMAIFPGYFPCGEISETAEYIKPPTMENPNGKIGFWYCTVDQSALHRNNLPNILPKKLMSSSGVCLENDWNSEDIIEDVFISNITIELLKSYENIGVTVEVKSGIVFSDKIKSCDMFSFLTDLMKLKNEQDTLKKQNDSKYNPALRECTKLLMNSVSGKVIEGLHLEQVKLIQSIVDMEKISAKYDVSVINNVGDAVFVSYTKTVEEEINSQRPVYIGAMIYEYARCYMYKNIMAPIGYDKLLYMDTDACKFRASDVAAWQTTNGSVNVPHWPEIEAADERYINHPLYDPNSKVFGAFENELGNNNYSFFLQKKSWMTANIVDGKPTYIKCRFKGVSTGSYLIYGDEPFIQIKNDKPVITADSKTVFDWMIQNEDRIIGGDYDAEDGTGFIGKQVEFYEHIYKHKYAYVLCSNFRKSVKNAKHAEIGETDRYNKLNNTVSMQYVVKKITIN